MSDQFHVDNPTAVEFQVSHETRTIRGLALPFGDVAQSGGLDWTFSKGSLSWSKVKVLDGHDWNRAVGTAELEETDEGLFMTAKIARGARGDEVLALAEDGVYDGLSVGLGPDIKASRKNGVNHAISGTIREVSLTPLPAFARASVTSVAASAALNEKESVMADNIETEVSTPAEAPDFSAVNARIEEVANQVAAMAEMKTPVATAQFQITEEPMYRFSGTEIAPSGHDFAQDVFNAAVNKDMAALDRVRNFTQENLTGPEFVTTTNISSVNQSTYRPDMFIGQAPTPTSPLFDTFKKGGLSDVKPFFWSKLDRAATTVAVADHTEGTEPTLTNLVTTTGATVTPSAVSGRVHITREAADMGNPQVSALVWAEFQRSFAIALETKTAALLAGAAASATALTTIANAANGQAAGQALESGLVSLQFEANGQRFTKGFLHANLYALLATYENGDGEKRYPIINPQNRDGISGNKYSFIDVAGYRMNPTHSLGAAHASNANLSWLADPNAVHVWNSGLQRLEKLQEKVEGWDIGCFAYFAGIVYDVSGLRKISYKPTA